MTIRSTIRYMGYLLGELVPWQGIAVARGRDYDAADLEADDEVWEPTSFAAVGAAEAPAVTPPVAGAGPAADDAIPPAPAAGPPTPTDLTHAAGVIRAYAVFGPVDSAERRDLRELANRINPT